MWVEAILSKDDLATVIAELCPLTLALGQVEEDDHYLRLLNPKDVALVEGRGLRLTCEAEIRWPVLGIDVPIRVESLTLMLTVSLASALDEEVLAFKPELENVAVSWVPNLFDGPMTEKINLELSKKHVEFSWHFFKTLSHVFELPGLLRPTTALDLQVAWGKVRVTEEAMVMAVSFHTRVLQSEAGQLLPRTPVSERIGPSAALNASVTPAASVTVPVPIAIAGAAALVGVAAYVAIGATTRLFRYVLVRA